MHWQLEQDDKDGWYLRSTHSGLCICTDSYSRTTRTVDTCTQLTVDCVNDCHYVVRSTPSDGQLWSVAMWYNCVFCVCLTLIWCSLPCLCMFDFDMVSLPCLFVTIFVSLQHFTKTVTDVTFRIDGECLCNCAIKSARWQHPAMRHWARFAVLSTTCFTGFTSCLCFILGLRLNTDRCWFSI